MQGLRSTVVRYRWEHDAVFDSLHRDTACFGAFVWDPRICSVSFNETKMWLCYQFPEQKNQPQRMRTVPAWLIFIKIHSVRSAWINWQKNMPTIITLCPCLDLLAMVAFNECQISSWPLVAKKRTNGANRKRTILWLWCPVLAPKRQHAPESA